jgi:hypothetical protein
LNRTEKPPSLEETHAPPLPQSDEAGSYSVRVKQTTGQRSRTLQVTALSEQEAALTASARLDEGWEILSVDLLKA